MADKSPTETGTDQSSSDVRDESLLEQDEQNPSADEQQDTGSGDEQSQDSADDKSGEPQKESTHEDSSDDDDSLAKFAKAQGFDPDNLTDGERKALKLARDNQKAFREKPSQGKEELDSAIDKVYDDSDVRDRDDIDNYEKRDIERDLRLARIESRQQLDDYFKQDPEAENYKKEAAEILQEIVESQGQQAAAVLARNKKYLFTLAKDKAGVFNSDAARETGRREERESLRKKQEAGAGEGHATQPGTSSTTKVTREWVDNEYDPSNPEHRKMVDAAMASGEIF